MAVTARTLRLANALRIALDREVDAATRDLVRAWARTWQTLTADWTAAVQALIDSAAEGEQPSRMQILRAERTLRAMAATREALEALSRQAGVRITAPLEDLVAQAAAGQNPIVASQLPPGGAAAELRASLVRVDAEQLAAIVARSTERVTTLASRLMPLGMDALNAELVRGVALGLNPRRVARNAVRATDLVAGLGRAYRLPLYRAMNIARTEMLDAHRGGAGVSHAANAKVIGQWMWLAQLDRRTCPSCWSQHGSTYPLDVPGPWDHQQGRCARMPVVKPWSELGFDIPEPPSLVADAQQTFDALPAAEQLAIMGPRRLAAYRDGTMPWGAMSTRRLNPGWRPSYVPTPLPRRAGRGRRAA